MKKINIIKISLDILMILIFALLFNKMVFSGQAFHEIAGLAIGLAFIIHKALNWKWLVQVTRNIFTGKISLRTRIGCVVDVLLLISMATIITSGVLISRVVFASAVWLHRQLSKHCMWRQHILPLPFLGYISGFTGVGL